jgi:hypothetical protein
MEDIYTTQKLLALRRLTRIAGEIINSQMREYIETLTPLFRQRAVFGEHIQGSGKETAKGAEQAIKELKRLYETIAIAAPFHLPKELDIPLMQMTSSLELTPWEYVHVAEPDGQRKRITVTSPFKWIVAYKGYSPRQLKELLGNRNRNESELQQAVLHYLAMHIVVSKQPGLAGMLGALHYSLASCQVPAFGSLPITYIASSISSRLPPDTLIIESTELSGKDAFEELINVDDIPMLDDPFRKKLMDTVESMQA